MTTKPDETVEQLRALQRRLRSIAQRNLNDADEARQDTRISADEHVQIFASAARWQMDGVRALDVAIDRLSVSEAARAEPQSKITMECDQCGLRQSEWKLPLIVGASCPKHYLDDDSCDGIIRLVRVSVVEATPADYKEACEQIVALSAGWDADGSIGPTPPMSWETVARLALDLARYAVRSS